MILPGVVGEMLPGRREDDAVDLGPRPLPHQGDLLVDLGEPAAEPAVALDRPSTDG